MDSSQLLIESDVIPLNVPTLPETRHFLNRKTLAELKPGAIIVNTGHGALIETQAPVDGLKSVSS